MRAKKSKEKKIRKFIQQKLKPCAFCQKDKKIFKNTPEGDMCWDCYKYSDFIQKVNINKDKKTTKNKMVMPPISPTLEADTKFSLLIRRIYMRDGIVPCYTCDTPMDIREAQCGHFIPRDNKATRWLKDNCRPQCKHCNEYLGGNLSEFEKRLELEIPGIVDNLKSLGRQVYSPTKGDMKDLIERLKKELTDLLKLQRGN